MPDEKPPDTSDKFTELLTKLAQVPKADIDEREREYQRESHPDRTKAGQIVPVPAKE